MIKKRILFIGLVLSLILNLTLLFFFEMTTYSESSKPGKHIITDYKPNNSTTDIQYFNGLKFNV